MSRNQYTYDRHLTGIVASARILLGAEQRFLRLIRRDFRERADNLMSRTCGNRFKAVSYTHLDVYKRQGSAPI